MKRSGITSGFKLGAHVDASVILQARQEQKIKIYSVWDWECYRKGKLLFREHNQNYCVDQGINSILNAYFDAATQIVAWYVAIFENNFVADGDETYAVPGYTECTAYDGGARPAYDPAPSTAKSLTNSGSKAVFTMNDTKTIYGGALVGGGAAASTPGNTAGGGTLFCASKFGSSRALLDDDVLNVTITINSADV